MAEVSCARCGKPWDAKYLRGQMAWYECVDCGAHIEKFKDGSWQDERSPWHGSPANCAHPLGGHLRWNDRHSAGVPDLIVDSLDPAAWLEAVLADLGCPECGLHDGRPLPKSVARTWRSWLRRKIGKVTS
ncbi:DNA-directed RNA polymerase subunit RPC12/RpoP [Kribbella aluminosa]|uniref:DNA-directed RNA polymerase subunit RPC12/RpoP n=1 Tax=Kribbella aluminosa TaxID=416017 RepID=A0ABS4UBU1_9ACTN|nr:DNA-directed RNA polymerase subunit RPC12/RpoP [Kribbella aluminosa]